MGLGSGENGQFTFLDSLCILGFFISLMNLDENLSQGDKQDLQNDLSEKMETILSEIHGHLQKQDKKLERVEKLLEELTNDSK